MTKSYKRIILKVLFILVLEGISTITYTSQSGPGPGLTGAPGDGNCTSCHSGSPVTSGTAFDAITLTGLPAGGYGPGSTYSLTLSGGAAATARNGFQIIALTPSNTMAGSFTAGTGNQVMISGSKSYVGHTLTGSSQTSWTFSWTAPSTGVGTITFYAAFNATNSSSSNAGDVIYLKTFNINPGTLPVATINSPAPAATFCVGDSVQFTGTATNNPISYAWDFLGNATNSSTLQNPKIKFPNTGFFTVRFRATNSSGTSPNAQIVIQVVANPTATITPSGNQTICGGDSITLTANSGTGFSYLWSPGNQTSQSIKVGNAGSFSVKVSNSTGCFANSTPVITSVSSKPLVTLLTSADTLCEKDSLLLTATTGMTFYRYYANNIQVDSGSTNTKKLKLNATVNTVAVRGFNGSCYSDLISKNIVIQSQDPAPIINCGTATSSTVIFSLPEPNTQISMDTGKTWIAPNSGSLHLVSGLSPNQNVLLMGRKQVNSRCLYTLYASKNCIASSCQPITYAVNYPSSKCLPAGPLMQSIKVSNASPTLPYYSFDNGPFSQKDTFSKLMQVGNNTILVRVIDSASASCGTKDSTITIKGIGPVSPKPVVAADKAKLCTNGDVAFTVTNPGVATKIAKYYLNSDTVPFATKTKAQGFGLSAAPVVSYGFKNADQLLLAVIDSVYNCPSFSDPLVLKVYNPAVPRVQYFKENLNIELRDTTPESVSRSWTFGDGNSASLTSRNQKHTYTAAGIYKVILTITDSNGCTNKDSNNVDIVSTGLATIKANTFMFSVYPNPATGSIIVEWDGHEKRNLELVNMQGQSLFQCEMQSESSVDLSGYSKGIYLLKLSKDEKTAYQKLLLE